MSNSAVEQVVLDRDDPCEIARAFLAQNSFYRESEYCPRRRMFRHILRGRRLPNGQVIELDHSLTDLAHALWAFLDKAKTRSRGRAVRFAPRQQDVDQLLAVLVVMYTSGHFDEWGVA